MTVEDALKELREMRFMRFRIERIETFDSASLSDLDLPCDKRVEISIWRERQSGKVIHGTSLDEAMVNVRQWKQSQEQL